MKITINIYYLLFQGFQTSLFRDYQLRYFEVTEFVIQRFRDLYDSVMIQLSNIHSLGLALILPVSFKIGRTLVFGHGGHLAVFKSHFIEHKPLLRQDEDRSVLGGSFKAGLGSFSDPLRQEFTEIIVGK